MSRRKTKIAGTRAASTARIPVCSVHESSEFMRRDVDGRWMCFQCADDWLKAELRRDTDGKSVGGIALPKGVEDERLKSASFLDAYPNRRARRAAKRAKVVST